MTRHPQIIALLTLSLFLSGCKNRWTNWFETESVVPEAIYAPKTANELVTIFKKATDSGKRVRMTGHGHAASDVAINADVLLTPENLNKPLNLDCKRLRANCDPALVRVESGIKVADLNKHLDSKGRALFNMGGYDGQTFAGVMMTATHGSGLAYGPLADQVISLQMVTDRGQLVQVEPSNGITDPAKFPGVLEEANLPVQLIQDDETFNAVRVSIGSMGIVYSVILKTDKKFWLREVRHVISWSELKKPGGYLDRAMRRLPIYGDGKPSPEHWELQYSPYLNDDGDHTFLITDRYHSYTPLPEQSSTHRGQEFTEIASWLIALVGTPLAKLIDFFPEISKPLLQMALNAQVESSFTNVSYRVFNIGAINNTEALGVESAFDIKDTIAAVERSFELSEDLLASKGMPLTSPIAIRLVKKSDALIAMQNGRDTSFMEIISLRAGRHAHKLLQTQQKAFLGEFNARPHWGLDLNTANGTNVPRLYPDTWEKWKSHFLRFNSAGTLDGKVTDRLGISVRPRPISIISPAEPPPLTQIEIPSLAEEEAARTAEQRRIMLPVFLKAIDDAIGQPRKMFAKSADPSREISLQKLREDVLKRNADITK